MTSRSTLQRSFAVILCICILLTNFIGLMTFTGEANVPTKGVVHHVADRSTMNNYTGALNIGTDTKNAGRVWADKSVFTSDIVLDMATDGYDGIIKNDSDFLHAFSTIGSSLEVEQDNVPLDVVFILDFSASMTENNVWATKDVSNTRIAKTLEAANNAINTLVNNSPNSRVGIAVYSTTAVRFLPLVKLVPKPGEVNTKWLDFELTSIYGDGIVYFTGNGQAAADEYTWNDPISRNNSIDIGRYSNSIRFQTNLQSGIALGMDMLATEGVTTWYSNKSEKSYTRTPTVIIMTDGQTNILSDSLDGEQANAWWNTDVDKNYHGGNLADEVYAGVAPIVLTNLLTASYNMTRIYENYYHTATDDIDNGKHVYTYSISVDTEPNDVALQKIYAILDPREYFTNVHNENNISLQGHKWNNEQIVAAYNKLQEWKELQEKTEKWIAKWTDPSEEKWNELWLEGWLDEWITEWVKYSKEKWEYDLRQLLPDNWEYLWDDKWLDDNKETWFPEWTDARISYYRTIYSKNFIDKCLNDWIADWLARCKAEYGPGWQKYWVEESKAKWGENWVEEWVRSNVVIGAGRVVDVSAAITKPVNISMFRNSGYDIDTIMENINYVDEFYDIAGDEQNDIFGNIIGRLISINMFRPVGGTNDVNLDNVLTYVDPIGKYMEIKDIKSILLFGELYRIEKDGGQVYYRKDGSEVTDQKDKDNRNYAYIQQNYRIVADEYILNNLCYSDEDHEVLFDLSKIEIYTKTTWDFRDPDIEDGNIRSDTGGDQSLYINIPVLAMPVQKATIQLDSAGNVATYKTNVADKRQSAPLRVFYTVGVAEAVKTTNGTVDLAKLSPDYVTSHKGPGGEVYLYSNWYNPVKAPYTDYVTGAKSDYTFGDAAITFSPDANNSFYKYQSPLPVYEGEENGGGPVVSDGHGGWILNGTPLQTITTIDADSWYYIITDYYTADKGHEYYATVRMGAEFGNGIGSAEFGEYLCFYDQTTGEVRPYTRGVTIPGFVIAAKQGGVSTGDLAQNIGSKGAGDHTETAETYYLPTISDSTSGDVLIVNIYLGNNGRCDITNTQLLVTKTLRSVDENDTDIADEYFNYTVELEGADGTAANSSYSAIKVTDVGGDNWRALIKSIELLTNNQGLLLKNGGTLATYKDSSNAEYYIFVGGDKDDESFTHTVFDNSDGSSLDTLLGGNLYADLTVKAYLIPVRDYDTKAASWEYVDGAYGNGIDFPIGTLDTRRMIGYEVEINEFQSTTIYEYEKLTFVNGRADFTLKGGEGVLLLGLDNNTKYTVTEMITDEQYDEKNIRLSTMKHNTESGSFEYVYYPTTDPKVGNGYIINEDAHEYTVNGTTGTDARREVHYCNYVPKSKKELTLPENDIVNVGDTAEYVIYWENYEINKYGEFQPADVTVKDKLDKGVDFVSAEFVKKITEPDGKTVRYEQIDPEWGSWEYDDETHTVIWTIEAEARQNGYVRLTVKVNENAAFAYDDEGEQLAELDNMISNTARVIIGESEVSSNTVDTTVGGVHKTETRIIYPDGEDTQVGAEHGNLKFDPTTGRYVGPLVGAGCEITYKITYLNYKSTAADITVTDRLDPDVEFIRAYYGDVVLEADNAENEIVSGNTRITFAPDTGTVKWVISGVPARAMDDVYLVVKVKSEEEEEEDEPTGMVFDLCEVNKDTKVLDEGTYIITYTYNGTTYVATTELQRYSTSQAVMVIKCVDSSDYNINEADNTITTEDESVMWTVMLDPMNDDRFVFKTYSGGQFLSGNSSVGFSFVTNFSGATRWQDSGYQGILVSINNNTKGGYFGGNNYQNTISMGAYSSAVRGVNFYKLREKETGGSTDGPWAEDDHKINNRASVMVDDDEEKDTETMENPMHGKITIEKQCFGQETDEEKVFDFTVILTLPEGGSFDPEALEITPETAIEWEMEGSEYTGKGSFKLKFGESVTISELSYNTEYTVTETQGSDFVLHHVTVNDEKAEDSSGQIKENLKFPDTKVVYYNMMKRTTFPSAGAEGTTRYYLFGSLLVLGATLWLLNEKKHRRAGT